MTETDSLIQQFIKIKEHKYHNLGSLMTSVDRSTSSIQKIGAAHPPSSAGNTKISGLDLQKKE
jgi:hypothetical protein